MTRGHLWAARVALCLMCGALPAVRAGAQPPGGPVVNLNVPQALIHDAGSPGFTPSADIQAMIASPYICYNGLKRKYADPRYGLTEETPSLVHVEIPTEGVQTFAYVWLPPDWDDRPARDRRMLVELPEHVNLDAVDMLKWHPWAKVNNLAILHPQLFVVGQAPPGYETVREREVGKGYYVGPRNIAALVAAAAGRWGVSSFLLEGFARSGAEAVSVAFYDTLGPNLVDLTVCNGGKIGWEDPLVEQMRSMGVRRLLNNRHFFVFLEERAGGDTGTGGNPTADVIGQFGGQVVVRSRDVRHGGLIGSSHDVLQEIFGIYRSLADTRLGG